MPNPPTLRSRIDQSLGDWLGTATAELEAIGTDLAPVAAAATEFLRGGKRLRPQFCYWGAMAAGGEDNEPLIRAAASLELVQACALAHDDLIDRSDTRRGEPSLHRRFEQQHRSGRLVGDSVSFGQASAILLGDVFLAWSDEMLSDANLTHDQWTRALPVWHEMRAEVMAGQYLDLLEQARADASVERALRVAQLKAGRYTVERPLAMGAAIADSNHEVNAILAEFGVDVGIAFQLRDDLLGVFGDPSVTGKPAGDDLREGKRTVLVALALESADEVQHKTLRGLLGRNLDESDVATGRAILTDTGARAAVEAMIDERLGRALASTESRTIDVTAAEALQDLAAAAAQRKL